MRILYGVVSVANLGVTIWSIASNEPPVLITVLAAFTCLINGYHCVTGR